MIIGSIRGLIEEGMPNHKRPSLKGNLYFKFDVEFPGDNFITEQHEFSVSPFVNLFIHLSPVHPFICPF